MRRALFVLSLSSVLIPVIAKADGIDFTNRFGSVTILSSGITSRESELMSFDGMSASNGHALGRVNFATGALSSGSLWTGGTFSSTGSMFDVIGQGSWMRQLPGMGGAKGKCALFTGAFTGTIDWTLASSNQQFREYVLSGDIAGTLWNGRFVEGQTTQIINTYSNQERINNWGSLGGGTTSLTSLTTPEPGSLGLLSLGLLTMIGMFRAKMFAT
ncbi:MAG: PEP-CTERM sorting domain-containing protein [Terriglobales bacterium]